MPNLTKVTLFGIRIFSLLLWIFIFSGAKQGNYSFRSKRGQNAFAIIDVGQQTYTSNILSFSTLGTYVRFPMAKSSRALLYSQGEISTRLFAVKFQTDTELCISRLTARNLNTVIDLLSTTS